MQSIAPNHDLGDLLVRFGRVKLPPAAKPIPEPVRIRD